MNPLLIPVGLFLFSFFIYLRTHCASFNINDSGETILVCCRLTISHSPGYPLHALWGKFNDVVFQLGQPMLRVTLASMWTSAMAVVFLYLILRGVIKSALENREGVLAPQEGGEDPGPDPLLGAWIWEVPALAGALIFAFSYQHWFQACGAKGGIYSLNTFLAILMIYLLLEMRQVGKFNRCFLLFAFAYGLSMAHHWPNQIIMPMAYLWLLFTAQRRMTPVELLAEALKPLSLASLVLGFFLGYWLFQTPLKALIMAILFLTMVLIIRVFGTVAWIRAFTLFLLGLGTYIFLPIRAIQNPVVNWWNPITLTSLVETVLRKGYEGIGDQRSLATLTRNFKRFNYLTSEQFGAVFTLVVFLLAAWGMWWLMRRERKPAVGLFLLGFGIWFSIMIFNNPAEGYQWTLDNFFTPVYLSVSFFAGAGMAALVEWVVQSWRTAATGWTLGVLCLGSALLPLKLDWNRNDQSRYVSAYDYGVNMLKSVSRDGVILCNGDIDILPLWYLQYVLGKRTEVGTLTMQLIPYDWYRNPLFKQYPFLAVPVADVRSPPQPVIQDMIRYHSKERAFYYTNIFTAPWMRDEKQAPPSVPEGFLWRFLGTKGMDFPITSDRINFLWWSYRLRCLDEPERGYWDEYTDVMKDSYGIGHEAMGLLCLTNNMPDLGLWCFENALKYRQPQTHSRLYLMMGDSYLLLGNPNAALNIYQQILERIPGDPLIYAKVGEAYFALGNLEAARQAFQTSLAQNPNQREAKLGMEALEKKSRKK